MSPETVMSIVRRAERRVGRPFGGLYRAEVSADVLRANGLRVHKEENYGLIPVWAIYFGKSSEAPTVLYGRTIESAFDRAVNPPKVKSRK